MKSIIGLVKPTIGEVFFDEENMHRLNDRDLKHPAFAFWIRIPECGVV